MKTLWACCAFIFSLALSPICFAQIDLENSQVDPLLQNFISSFTHILGVIKCFKLNFLYTVLSFSCPHMILTWYLFCRFTCRLRCTYQLIDRKWNDIYLFLIIMKIATYWTIIWHFKTDIPLKRLSITLWKNTLIDLSQVCFVHYQNQRHICGVVQI